MKAPHSTLGKEEKRKTRKTIDFIEKRAQHYKTPKENKPPQIRTIDQASPLSQSGKEKEEASLSPYRHNDSTGQKPKTPENSMHCPLAIGATPLGAMRERTETKERLVVSGVF